MCRVCLCLLPIKGHRGPSGKGKCKNLTDEILNMPEANNKSERKAGTPQPDLDGRGQSFINYFKKLKKPTFIDDLDNICLSLDDKGHEGSVPTAVTNDESVPTAVTNEESVTTAVTDESVPTEVTNDESVPTEVTNDESVLTALTNDLVVPTAAKNDGIVPTATTNDGVVHTAVTNDAVVPTAVTNDGVVPTAVTNDESVPTAVYNDKREEGRSKPKKRKASSKVLKVNKKPKSSGFDYFLPMQEWKNVYSKHNLVESLNVKSKPAEHATNGLPAVQGDIINIGPLDKNSLTSERITSEEIRTDENQLVKISAGRPNRKCKDKDCTFCNLTEKCGQCRNCKNPRLKQKCVLRYNFNQKNIF